VSQTKVTSTARAARCAAALATGVLLFLCCMPAGAARASAGSQALASASHSPCTGPGSAHRPCRFGTPSGNIRCLWTPSPDSVACVLRASGRAFRLRPSGRAKAISLHLGGHGQTLRPNEQILFPHSLSCHDTKSTMTCNQDFSFGAFTLSPHGSHGS
jgi:hypothetical protein